MEKVMDSQENKRVKRVTYCESKTERENNIWKEEMVCNAYHERQ